MAIEIKHGDTTIILEEATNRLRDAARQIGVKLMDQGLNSTTVTEYSAIVVRTKLVINGWQPPSRHASKEELIEGLNYWLDHVHTDLTDVWLEGIFNPNRDPVTSPVPLGENADPN